MFSPSFALSGPNMLHVDVTTEKEDLEIDKRSQTDEKGHSTN